MLQVVRKYFFFRLEVPGHLLLYQGITPFILLVAGVAFHPEPLDLVTRAGGLKPLPQVDVLHGLLGGGQPAVAFPA